MVKTKGDTHCNCFSLQSLNVHMIIICTKPWLLYKLMDRTTQGLSIEYKFLCVYGIRSPGALPYNESLPQDCSP